jgi:hypothetical protein
VRFFIMSQNKLTTGIKNILKLPGFFAAKTASLLFGTSQIELTTKSNFYQIIQNKGILNLGIALVDKIIHKLNQGKLSQWSEKTRQGLEFYAKKLANFIGGRQTNISIIFYFSLLFALLSVPLILIINALFPAVMAMNIAFFGSMTTVVIVLPIMVFLSTICLATNLDLLITNLIHRKILNADVVKEILDPAHILFDHSSGFIFSNEDENIYEKNKTIDTDIDKQNIFDLIGYGSLFNKNNDSNEENLETQVDQKLGNTETYI